MASRGGTALRDVRVAPLKRPRQSSTCGAISSGSVLQPFGPSAALRLSIRSAGRVTAAVMASGRPWAQQRVAGGH